MPLLNLRRRIVFLIRIYKSSLSHRKKIWKKKKKKINRKSKRAGCNKRQGMQGSLKGGAGIGIESPTDRLFRNPEHQSDAAFCGESRSWTYEIPAVALHQKDFWDFSSGKQHKNRWQKHERGAENEWSGRY